VPVSLLAAIGSELARRNGLRGAAVRLRWLARGRRAVARLPADVFWVSLRALTQLVSPARSRGILRAVPFDHGQYSAISILGALGIAVLGLFGRPLRGRAPARLSAPWLRVLHALRDLHPGHR